MSRTQDRERRRQIIKQFLFFSYPALLAWVFTRIFYPGFMSYDTFHALNAARGEVTESIWPPMVSYVWRVVDFFSDDPSSMHFFQVALLLLALNVIIFKLTNSKVVSFGFYLAFFIVPVIAGTLAVIWKDVLTTSFMLSAFGLSLFIPDIKSSKSKSVLALVSLSFLVLIFLGISTRHNSNSSRFERAGSRFIKPKPASSESPVARSRAMGF
jgi:hypothetical protein